MTEAHSNLIALLDGFAPFYDLEYDEYDADLDYYQQHAARAAPRRKAAATVLDLACGTGRVARALAAAGHHVTGVDASPAMLVRAAARADEAGVSLRLVESTLQALPGPATLGRFDLALCAINSFAYLTTTAEQLAVLRQVHALLRKDGLLLLDLTPVPPDGPAPDHHEVLQQGTWTLEDGATVAKFVTGTWDPATQIHAVTWIYDVTSAAGIVQRTVLPQPFRYLYRYEAEHLLARAGLRLTHVYGDYDLTPYTATAERLLLVAKRVMSDER